MQKAMSCKSQVLPAPLALRAHASRTGTRFFVFRFFFDEAVESGSFRLLVRLVEGDLFFCFYAHCVLLLLPYYVVFLVWLESLVLACSVQVNAVEASSEEVLRKIVSLKKSALEFGKTIDVALV